MTLQITFSSGLISSLMVEMAKTLNIEAPDLCVCQSPATNAYTLAVSAEEWRDDTRETALSHFKSAGQLLLRLTARVDDVHKIWSMSYVTLFEISLKMQRLSGKSVHEVVMSLPNNSHEYSCLVFTHESSFYDVSCYIYVSVCDKIRLYCCIVIASIILNKVLKFQLAFRR
ncbi:uncharacterized protein LOC132635676 isoform X2 [Lycium barbarum]|uniref:uncharacterized protein LOC132635676 isoform X2 n=1 Tax=Lycium barbarum TaxID=112863 RepID=UPI00293F5CEB|nr:uncharacterized protein LOC132635676 isoform X2 [Lycium barbarum]XP_060208146.1 uncharacterized protein LOC132635676 isoform X2 [Lycium barbarum]XP_060208147.1 uncharacterized protein LOC132635676 isoform X2 [Lycium barbarum]XP_060208148.1 uncharacterized protein LOC132635676 isoform X2 [Lycium barbarum]XP_060208149.1 uncharacterized protein LOC132635676 isoform X2 [Lycium barbarum]